jgi:hypothetical protein
MSQIKCPNFSNIFHLLLGPLGSAGLIVRQGRTVRFHYHKFARWKQTEHRKRTIYRATAIPISNMAIGLMIGRGGTPRPPLFPLTLSAFTVHACGNELADGFDLSGHPSQAVLTPAVALNLPIGQSIQAVAREFGEYVPAHLLSLTCEDHA